MTIFDFKCHNTEMPSLTKHELDEIIGQSSFVNERFQTFIETGTYRGETIFAMEAYFDTLHTIEIKKDFYDECRGKYNGTKIHFHLGDSSTTLPTLLPSVKGNVVFFLDGHFSSKNTGRGNKDVPLFEELDAIRALLAGKAVIIIDDYRLFGRHPKALFKYSLENWRSINKRSLVLRLQSRVVSEFVCGDRFVICVTTSPDN